jgi:hypothetical protein
LVFDSLDAVESVLLEALITLENDKPRVQSLTSFDWIISNELTAT